MPDYQGTCDVTDVLAEIKRELQEIRDLVGTGSSSYDDEWIRTKHEDLDVKMAGFTTDISNHSNLFAWMTNYVLIPLSTVVGGVVINEIAVPGSTAQLVEMVMTAGGGVRGSVTTLGQNTRKALDIGNAAKSLAQSAKNVSSEALKKVLELGTLVNSPIKGLPFLKGKVALLAAIALAIAAAIGLTYKAKIDADVREASVDIEVLDGQVENRVINSIMKLQNDFNQFIREHTTIHGVIDRFERETKTLTATHTRDISDLKTKAENRNNDAYKAKQDISRLDVSVRTLETKAESRNNDAWQAKQDISFLRGEIQSLNSRADARNTDAWQAKQDIKSLEAAIEVLESKASNRNEDAYKAKQDIATLERAIGVLESKANSRNEDAYKAKQDIIALQSEINQLRGNTQNEPTNTNSLGNEIASLRNSIDNLRQSGDINSRAIDNLESQLDRYQNGGEVFQNNATNSLNQLDRTLNDALSDINALEQSQARQDAEIRGLTQNPARGLQGERGATGAKGDKGDAANTVALEAAISSLRGRVDQIDSSVGTLGTGLGSTNTNLENAWNKIRENAGLIAGITATLGTALIAIEALKNRTMACSWTRTEITSVQTSLANQNRILLALETVSNATIVPATLFIKNTVTSISSALTTNVVPTLNVLSTGVNAIKTGVTSGFKWLASDRMINIVNMVTTLHNATFLSRDIGETLFGVADTVLAIMGKQLKDSEGETIEVGELLSARLESAITSAIGSKAYAELLVRWQKFSTIYTSAANMLGSIRNIQDSIISGVEVAAGNSAKVGNALQKYGVISENATNWMSENPNFDSPLLMKLEKAESIASSLSSVTSDVRDIQEESNEFKQQKAELKARLESKNPEDGSDWSVNAGVETELEKQRTEATRFENVSLDDVKP